MDRPSTRINNNGSNNNNRMNFGESSRKKLRLTSHEGFVAEKPHLKRPPRLSSFNGQSKNKGNSNASVERVRANDNDEDKSLPYKASDKVSKLGKCTACKQVRTLTAGGTCLKPCLPQLRKMKNASANNNRNSTRSIRVLNIAAPEREDSRGVNRPNRPNFFLHQPSAYFTGKKLWHHAPFSYYASTMGLEASSVCGVCGNGDNLGFTCARCKLSFHDNCISRCGNNNNSNSVLCNACKPHTDNGAGGLLKAVVDNASQGNPMDFVLQPALHALFIDKYCADWLRCVKCSRVSLVHPEVLSECAHIPFECQHAFWNQDQRGCESALKEENKHMMEAARHINKQVAGRARRRTALFAKHFGEKHRALFAPNTQRPPMKKRRPPSLPRLPLPHQRPMGNLNSNPIANRNPNTNPSCTASLPYNARHPPGRPSLPTGMGARALPARSHLRPLPHSSPIPRPMSMPVRGPARPSPPVAKPPRTTPETPGFDKEVAKDRILACIGALGARDKRLEDILVDLVVLEDRQVFAFYKAFWCRDPELFNRQLVRYARSFAPKPANPNNPNNPSNPVIRTNGLQLSPRERMLLHERFRRIRLRQLGEGIALERGMLLEMERAPTEDIPAIHQRHTAAKKSKADVDTRQMHNLVYSIPGVTVSHPQ